MDNVVAHDIEKSDRTDDVKITESLTFSTMLLPEYILRGLNSAGFKKPSPIQLAAIPRARCGLDLIVQAKSGTGKTLVFTVTALESINVELKRVQVIVIAPTREIAIQIADVIKTVGSAMKGLKVSVLVGGRPLVQDKPDVQGCQIAVGCPGRLRHLIEQNILDSQAVRLLVLDEADKLFCDEYDYQKDIIYVYNKCGETKQVLALSATYPPEMLEFTQRFMRCGQHVTPSGGPTPVLLGLRQTVLITRDHPDYNVRMAAKEKELFHILETVPFDQCCIFHQYATRAESMNMVLRKKGFASVCLTAKQDMEERKEALKAVKSNRCRILVTTDIAARGIDAANINLVINMGLPWDPASYLHRMGRAGRYGSQGICISLISDGLELIKFQKLLGKIGGASMAVYIVPKIRKYDLWNDDLDDYDKLCGVITTEGEESDNSAILIDGTESNYSKSSLSQDNITKTSSKNGNSKIKTHNRFSLTELQRELDRFVEKEKKLMTETSIKNKKKSSPKHHSVTYSDVVSGIKQVNTSAKIAKEDKTDCDNQKPTPKKDTALKRISPEGISNEKNHQVDVDNSLLNVSRKRKRDTCQYPSSSSDFDSDLLYAEDSDDTMYTIDDIDDDINDGDSPSGIDLNADDDDFESLSAITSEDECHSSVSDMSCPKCKHRCFCTFCDSAPPTDWYYVISKEINNYVTYCRRFQVK